MNDKKNPSQDNVMNSNDEDDTSPLSQASVKDSVENDKYSGESHGSGLEVNDDNPSEDLNLDEGVDKPLAHEADILSESDIEFYHDDFAELKHIIEAAILVANEPIGLKKIRSLFPEEAIPSDESIKSCLVKLQKECDARGIELKQIGKGFRFQSKEKYATWLRRLQGQKIPRYSRAVLETLAIIAYRQPVTRADIEEIRGVTVSSDIIKTLISREWINEVGKKEVPGRPSLYGTSSEFLSYFNCQGLSDLPDLPDVRELSQIAKENQIELPDLINESLAAQWQEQIAAIHEEGIDDELPEPIEINLNPFSAPKPSDEITDEITDETDESIDADFNGEEVIHEINHDEKEKP